MLSETASWSINAPELRALCPDAGVLSERQNQRSPAVRGGRRTGPLGRWRDLEALYAEDLGGAAALSEFQLGLIGTCATLRCELEKLEGRLSVGEAVDLDQFGRLAGHYRRICETLGIERRKRDVTPDLQSYLAAKGAASGDP